MRLKRFSRPLFLALQRQKSAICATFAPVLAIFYLRVRGPERDAGCSTPAAAAAAGGNEAPDELRPRHSLGASKCGIEGCCWRPTVLGSTDRDRGFQGERS